MDGGAWWVTVHGVAESDTAERLHFHFLPHIFGLPKGVLVVKNPPANAGDTSSKPSSIPSRGAKIPHAAGQLSPCGATTEVCAL